MKKLHISQRSMIVIGILLLAVSISLTAGVYARYVVSATSANKITAKTFYFTSNYLTENNHEYKLNAGTDSVTIDLYNYDCENPKLVSEVDCSYVVSVETNDPEVFINDNKTTIASVNYDYAISDPGAKTQDVKLSGLNNGYSYIVAVTATGGDVVNGTIQPGGYVKTLSATFTVADTTDGFYMNVDDTTDPHYIVLTVWTENITGTVNVNYEGMGLIPDSTNPILAAVKNYKDGSYGNIFFSDNVNFTTSYSSYSYRFFKTSGYNAGGFTVKLGESRLAVESNIP